jgi:4-hydroxy-3-methylbut-2-enyl diphosphate reductase
MIPKTTDRVHARRNVLPKRGRTLLLARPRGFCAGVRRAVETAGAAVARLRPPVFCLREIVHNRQVVAALRRDGVLFVDDLDAVPDGGTVIFSAHGVAPAVRTAAKGRRLSVIDATCPFVSKVHAEVRRFVQQGCTVLVIGNPGHDEVVGVVGEAPGQVSVVPSEDAAAKVVVPDPRRVGVVMQTTLSLPEADRVLAVLRARYPKLRTPAQADICYATTNRQRAMGEVARAADRTIVLGSRNSSNSLRLVEVARAAGCPATLVSTRAELRRLRFAGVRVLGLTAGASTPEEFISRTVADLAKRGFDRIVECGTAVETLHFRPVRLR